MGFLQRFTDAFNKSARDHHTKNKLVYKTQFMAASHVAKNKIADDSEHNACMNTMETLSRWALMQGKIGSMALETQGLVLYGLMDRDEPEKGFFEMLDDLSASVQEVSDHFKKKQINTKDRVKCIEALELIKEVRHGFTKFPEQIRDLWHTTSREGFTRESVMHQLFGFREKAVTASSSLWGASSLPRP